MKAVLQRVQHASVTINGNCHSQINQGLMVLLGIAQTDTEATARKMIDKLLKYRVFSDTEGKMNLSLKDLGGELLLVSQFTLQADTQKGLRPGFSRAGYPSMAEPLYQYAIDYARSSYQLDKVKDGQFGGDMQVSLLNDGPVTFLLAIDE